MLCDDWHRMKRYTGSGSGGSGGSGCGSGGGGGGGGGVGQESAPHLIDTLVMRNLRGKHRH